MHHHLSNQILISGNYQSMPLRRMVFLADSALGVPHGGNSSSPFLGHLDDDSLQAQDGRLVVIVSKTDCQKASINNHTLTNMIIRWLCVPCDCNRVGYTTVQIVHEVLYEHLGALGAVAGSFGAGRTHQAALRDFGCY